MKSATIISIDSSDAGSGVKSVEHRTWGQIGWSEWQAYVSPFSFTGEVIHYIESRSSDRLDNSVTWNESLIVDDSPPSLSIQPETSEASLDTLFMLTADDGPGSGVSLIEYRIDDGLWTPYASPFSLPKGKHTISYRSLDRLSNSIEKSIKVDVVSESIGKPLIPATKSPAGPCQTARG